MRFWSLCDSNSSSLIITGKTMTSWVPKDTTRRSSELFRSDFDRQNSTSFWRALIDVISTGVNSTLYRSTFFAKRAKIPRYFDAIFWCNFDGWKIDTTPTCFFWCVFERQNILVVLISIWFHLIWLQSQWFLARNVFWKPL